MPLQLAPYTDRFGSTHPAPYAVIKAIKTAIPPSATTKCWIQVFISAAAEAAQEDYVFSEERELAFNPFSATAANDAYTALSQEGGIYTGSSIV